MHCVNISKEKYIIVSQTIWAIYSVYGENIVSCAYSITPASIKRSSVNRLLPSSCHFPTVYCRKTARKRVLFCSSYGYMVYRINYFSFLV